jgi:hypothetical protein
LSKNTSTLLVDIGILLALVAISFGIWFYPWITLLLLALLLLGGCLTGQHPD